MIRYNYIIDKLCEYYDALFIPTLNVELFL